MLVVVLSRFQGDAQIDLDTHTPHGLSLDSQEYDFRVGGEGEVQDLERILSIHVSRRTRRLTSCSGFLQRRGICSTRSVLVLNRRIFGASIDGECAKEWFQA